MKRCFFIGHRYADFSIYDRLYQAVEAAIAKGVTEFIVGHYGAFDRLAAKAVKQAKKTHEVRLVMLLPYHPALRPMERPEGFDAFFYPSGMERVPLRLAIVQANRRVVEEVDYVIAYVRHGSGNSAKILNYAERLSRKKTMQIYNIGEEKEQA
ncbi:MAG: hypothetical protein IKC73_07475 [Clostridia bacterium]|nr:hypothetical protein [Clostridia bacterium]